MFIAREQRLGEGRPRGEEIRQTQFELPLLLDRGDACQEGELLRPSKKITMRPFCLRPEPFRGTIAEAKLQAMRFALDDFELDVQWLTRCLGIQRPRGYGLEHAQAIDRIRRGIEVFIADALSLVNRQLTTYSELLDLLFPLDVNATKNGLRPRGKRKRHGSGMLFGIDLGTWNDLGARIASIVEAGEQQSLAAIKILFVDWLLRSQR